MLVSTCDGLGTKADLYMYLGKFMACGICCVNAVVNDLLCCGADPIGFQDSISTSRLIPQVMHGIVQGVQAGCDYCQIPLLGGEMAEITNFHPTTNANFKDAVHHEINGFAMGVVDRSKLIDGSEIQAGDVLIGLPSNGLHANGYSIVHRLIYDGKIEWYLTPREAEIIKGQLDEMMLMASVGELDPKEVEAYQNELQVKAKRIQPIADALLKPTKLYLKAVNSVKKRVKVLGMSHITGGGLPANLPRMLTNNDAKDSLIFDVNIHTWEPQDIFQFLKEKAEMTDEEMWRVYNCGIGYVICVRYDDQEEALEALADVYEDGAEVIGEIIQRVEKDDERPQVVLA